MPRRSAAAAAEAEEGPEVLLCAPTWRTPHFMYAFCEKHGKPRPPAEQGAQAVAWFREHVFGPPPVVNATRATDGSLRVVYGTTGRRACVQTLVVPHSDVLLVVAGRYFDQASVDEIGAGPE